MAANNHDHIEKLTCLVRIMIEKLESGINGQVGVHDLSFERLFGTRKSYADVLVDLSEVMLKLHAASSKPSACKIAGESTVGRIDDNDVSLIKYYINRQRRLTETPADSAN